MIGGVAELREVLLAQEQPERSTLPWWQPGSRLGPYVLQRLLGRGGFGEVYAAEDTAMNRVVALKLMSASYSRDPLFRQRLFREAQTAGRLHEPHVVPIHGCGEINGQLFIDMRLIDGCTLRTVLADGALHPTRAVAIVGQIAAALDAAHAEEIIHRDVKPANILLTGGDFAYLADFGLANAAADTKITTSGTTVGSFAYMAPERLAGDPVDHRADIYSLACVLHECLTGAPPYTGAELSALIAAHLDAPIPRPSTRRPSVPTVFDDVIAGGMAKDPADRYPSAGLLAAAARSALTRAQPLPPKAAPPPAKHRRRTAAVIAAISAAVVAIVAVLAWPAQRTTAPAPTAAPAGPIPATLPFTGLKTPAGVAVDTHDSVYVVDLGNRRVLKLAAGATSPSTLPFPGLVSPRGIAIDAHGSVYVTDTSLKQVLKLSADADGPIVLPFAGVEYPSDVAVDSAGNVFVADLHRDQVLRLKVGADTPDVLAFTGLDGPYGVALDAAANIYITDNHRVLKQAVGVGAPTVVLFSGLNGLAGVAVDDAGVYFTDYDQNQVLKLAGPAKTPTPLPFPGLITPFDVAVDSAGAVYVTDSRGVVKLPAG